MKRTRYVLFAVLFLVVMGSAVAVYADQGAVPDPSDGSLIDESHPHPPRGLRGEVTARGADSLTLLVRDDVSVQVNVGEDTKVWLVETESQGSLADIAVGDKVLVRGRRAESSDPEAPAVDARLIAVAPDGDETHGRVTAVEGGVITLATRQPDGPAEDPAAGEATVITDGDTRFRVGRQEGTLADVTEGKFVVAVGETQSDGSLLARLVIVHPKRDGGNQEPRGGPPPGSTPGGQPPQGPPPDRGQGEGRPGNAGPRDPGPGDNGPGSVPLPARRLGSERVLKVSVPVIHCGDGQKSIPE